jgi:hypothetical protein
MLYVAHIKVITYTRMIKALLFDLDDTRAPTTKGSSPVLSFQSSVYND